MLCEFGTVALAEFAGAHDGGGDEKAYGPGVVCREWVGYAEERVDETCVRTGR